MNFFSNKMLSSCHIGLLALSNLLVQYPFELFGYATTWGAFTYPMIFILTDLTTRLRTAHAARQIIFQSMLPALFISYGITAAIGDTHHFLTLRIAFASFTAYAVGQLLDIFVFQTYRNRAAWWIAPALSSTVGNLIDTLLFFSIAFYHCNHSFLSQHWVEIASVDLLFKITISLVAFVPVYGVLLKILSQKKITESADIPV